MMTRQSFDGAASTGSSAEEMLRLPALTSTARRPPNSGIVCASSTSRDGLAESSSPSMRTNANGSLGSSTAARTSASTRSRTSPASGPNTSTIGWAGSGLAMKRSTSEALMAVMQTLLSAPLSRGRQSALRPRHEIRRQAGADVVRDHLGGAVLGVAQAAVAGEALLLAGNVVGHARESLPGDDRLAGRDVLQRIGGVDAVVLDVRAGGGDVDDHLRVAGGEPDVEFVVGRGGGGAAGEFIHQTVAHLDADAGEAGAVGRIDRRDFDAAQLVGDGGAGARGLGAVQRLEAAGGEAGQRQRGQDAGQFPTPE